MQDCTSLHQIFGQLGRDNSGVQTYWWWDAKTGEILLDRKGLKERCVVAVESCKISEVCQAVLSKEGKR
jgi:hypothetical protein